MKIKDLRIKTPDEWCTELDLYKKELFNLRFQSVYVKLTKTHRIRQLKRGVARVKTLLREAQLKDYTTKRA